MGRTVHDESPLNAEPDSKDLVESFITPQNKFFDRNHGDIPEIDPATHKVHFTSTSDLGVDLKHYSLSVTDILHAEATDEIIAVLSLCQTSAVLISYKMS